MNDFILDSEGDLLFENGDLVIGESTLQHQQLLLTTAKGEWKQWPKVGIGMDDFLNDDTVNSMMNEISHQFELDGMKVKSINSGDGKLYIDASYLVI